MVNLEDLMFRREHFPVRVYETTGRGNRKFFNFERIEIPPYHPFMIEYGIPFELVLNYRHILYQAIDNTISDLKGIADKRQDIQRLVESTERDSKLEITQTESGITVNNCPIVGHFWVGQEGINPYGYHMDQGITIDPELGPKSFIVPENVTFSPELIKEYDMEESEYYSLLGLKRINCPYLWHRHNLAKINAIFYKNLVIALDNSVVRQKYSK